MRVRSAPADGQANTAAAAPPAKAPGVPRRDVALVQGVAAGVMVFEVPRSEAEVRARHAGSGG